ncbi:MAG: hypothetical protein BGO69_16555 [Bacteroidetes bacterium 46-16]|nr:MAG: hypothetical protein BGO69_16555 [Bacteroidetes bacterium 46-16]
MKHEGIKGILHTAIEQADEKLLKLMYMMVKGYGNNEQAIAAMAELKEPRPKAMLFKREAV